ncbi:hypothetical protein ADS31_07030 [Brucella melitensis]|nr:hypothetical protein M798_00300 [Brucella melitensis ADMAS-G1]KPJ37142.1 hypothetical protein ADS31_07030 [Brucella melitensis]
MRAIARMDKMGVAINQSRRDEPVAAIYLLKGSIFVRKLVFRTGIDDPGVLDDQCSFFDQAEICGLFFQRRNARMGENGA